MTFKVRAISVLKVDGYDFEGGPGGRYRRADITLYVRDQEGRLKKL